MPSLRRSHWCTSIIVHKRLDAEPLNRKKVQEELTMRIIAHTRNYPSELVRQGHVHIDKDDLAKIIGSVFLEKTELNLQVSTLPPTACVVRSTHHAVGSSPSS